MTVEHEDDVIGLSRSGAVVSEAIRAIASHVEPGVSTADLDAVGREVLARHGARSAPQRAYDFPGFTCISVNDAVAHGVPSPDVFLREGDLVNVDVSVELEGYWTDAGASLPVGAVSRRRQKLLRATHRAQQAGMRAARAGAPLREIGKAVSRCARRHGFGVIRSLGGHGVGRFIHEPPHVSNVPQGAEPTRLWEGLVMTVEPFLTTGATDVLEDADGWTLRTPDGSVGAQFEHTLIVTTGEPIVLTA